MEVPFNPEVPDDKLNLTNMEVPDDEQDPANMEVSFNPEVPDDEQDPANMEVSFNPEVPDDEQDPASTEVSFNLEVPDDKEDDNLVTYGNGNMPFSNQPSGSLLHTNDQHSDMLTNGNQANKQKVSFNPEVPDNEEDNNVFAYGNSNMPFSNQPSDSLLHTNDQHSDMLTNGNQANKQKVSFNPEVPDDEEDDNVFAYGNGNIPFSNQPSDSLLHTNDQHSNMLTNGNQANKQKVSFNPEVPDDEEDDNIFAYGNGNMPFLNQPSGSLLHTNDQHSDMLTNGNQANKQNVRTKNQTPRR